MVYSFDINNRAFNAIKEGRKKFEIRVTKVDGSFDYSVIKKDDFIKLTSFDKEKMICRVLDVRWYNSAEELLTVEGCEYTLSSTNDFYEGVKSLHRFNGYTEGILKNGIYAINIEQAVRIDRKVLLSEFSCIDNINLDDYIKCREKVKEDMEHSEWLGDFTKDVLESLLNTGSKIWMYYHENNFVSSMMMIPADEESLRKFGVYFDCSEVVDYGPMMVSSKYQGNGLQYQMLEELDKYSKECGYKYAMATIHPDNYFSIYNLEKDGFKLIGNKDFKRGNRNIYLKEFN